MGIAEDVYSAGTSPDMRGTYYADRPFEDWQMKLLIDAVSQAAFLSDSDAGLMTKKLLEMTGPASRSLLENNMQKHVTAPASRFRYTLDALLTAIKEERQVTFRYFDLSDEGEKIFRKDGRRYRVNPYNIYWIAQSYYLICNTDGKDGLGAYRLDRMDSVTKTEDKRLPVTKLPEGDLSEKAARFPEVNASRFMGDTLPVDIRCDAKWLGSLRDVFGYNNVRKLRGSTDQKAKSIYRVLTVDSEGLYISLMQLGGKVEVVAPKKVRVTLKDKLAEVLRLYDSPYAGKSLR
jgi:predicted DNA-binding transcriptional regulator YafY